MLDLITSVLALVATVAVMPLDDTHPHINP